MGREAMSAYQREVGQASPSKKFKRIGQYDIQGIIQGVEAEKPKFAAAYEDAARLALSSMERALPSSVEVPSASAGDKQPDGGNMLTRCELVEPLVSCEVGFQEMTVAAMADRQRIEQTYARGATPRFIVRRYWQIATNPPARNGLFSYRKKYGEIRQVFSYLPSQRGLSANRSGERFFHFLCRLLRSFPLRSIAFFVVWRCEMLGSRSLGLRFRLSFAR